MARNQWATEEAFDLIRERALVHDASLREAADPVLDEEASAASPGEGGGDR